MIFKGDQINLLIAVEDLSTILPKVRNHATYLVITIQLCYHLFQVLEVPNLFLTGVLDNEVFLLVYASSVKRVISALFLLFFRIGGRGDQNIGDIWA